MYLRRDACVPRCPYLFPGLHPESVVCAAPVHATAIKYRIDVAGCTKPWADSMRPYMTRVLGSDTLGAQTLELLLAAWAPTTATPYASCRVVFKALTLAKTVRSELGRAWAKDPGTWRA